MEQKNCSLRKIATIYTDFTEKFGIPRQSGLVKELQGNIVFEEEFQTAESLLGIEEFSHLWLLWGFSEEKSQHFKPTVCPPRLGGKIKKGVFATRSPRRPNKIGLSCVKLEKVIWSGSRGPELIVSGIDMLSGTPIYDIKPYLPYTDAHPQALGGFGEKHRKDGVEVEFPQKLLARLPEEKRKSALQILEQDPRAAYQKQPDYLYGLCFAGFDIRFTTENGRIVVRDVVERRQGEYHNVK